MLGTSFLGLDHGHVSTHAWVSSFHLETDPAAMAARAEQAALRSEDDAAFALRKAVSVNLVSERAIIYCYGAVFFATVTALISIANGVVDLWSTKRDEAMVDGVQEGLQTSGWPAYRARFLPAQEQRASSAAPPTTNPQPTPGAAQR